MATGPTVEQIDEFSGGGAVEPIRVYVGLDTEPTLQGRADLLLAELQRTGAFDREVLVVATTTGTGFLDPAAVDPLEYMFNGDTAIAGVQYSFLPSWISLLADQDAVKETSRVVFDTVNDYWTTLPENDRPDLYLYGLSLGSFGVESVLNSINLINEPIDGAFMSGPAVRQPAAQRDRGRPRSGQSGMAADVRAWPHGAVHVVRFPDRRGGRREVGTDAAGVPAALVGPGRVLQPGPGPRGARVAACPVSAARTSPRR